MTEDQIRADERSKIYESLYRIASHPDVLPEAKYFVAFAAEHVKAGHMVAQNPEWGTRHCYKCEQTFVFLDGHLCPFDLDQFEDYLEEKFRIHLPNEEK